MRRCILTRAFVLRSYLMRAPREDDQFGTLLRATHEAGAVYVPGAKARLQRDARDAATKGFYHSAAGIPGVNGKAELSDSSHGVFRPAFGRCEFDKVIEVKEELFDLSCTKELLRHTVDLLPRSDFFSIARERVFAATPRMRMTSSDAEFFDELYRTWGLLRVPTAVKILELFGKIAESNEFVELCDRRKPQ